MISHIPPQLFALLLLVSNSYSYNLLCDPTLIWDYSPVPTAFTLNHTSCELQVSQSVNSVEHALTDVALIFSNPLNYPLNFTIIGNAVCSFGITYKIGALYSDYSVSPPPTGPKTITYEWRSATSNRMYYYLDGEVQHGLGSIMTEWASYITDVGFHVETDQIPGNIDLIFSYAQLNQLTMNPTSTPTTSNPTTSNPTTSTPTTLNPTTSNPTTSMPTLGPITSEPTTITPTTITPTTSNPTTLIPTTRIPTTLIPTTTTSVPVPSGRPTRFAENGQVSDISTTILNLANDGNKKYEQSQIINQSLVIIVICAMSVLVVISIIFICRIYISRRSKQKIIEHITSTAYSQSDKQTKRVQLELGPIKSSKSTPLQTDMVYIDSDTNIGNDEFVDFIHDAKDNKVGKRVGLMSQKSGEQLIGYDMDNANDEEVIEDHMISPKESEGMVEHLYDEQHDDEFEIIGDDITPTVKTA